MLHPLIAPDPAYVLLPKQGNSVSVGSVAQEAPAAAPRVAARRAGVAAWAPYLQVTPLTALFLLFLAVPIVTIVVVSFWDYDTVRVIPDMLLTNYRELLESPVTWRTYGNTLRYATMVWALTLAIGFAVAYFLAFHVQSVTWQMALFLLCTIPFWTSNIIRMISWIPFLGRNGLLNTTLIDLGVIREPLEFLLFSDFAVVLAYVHLYALFMVVPIFNSMMRIDRSLIEAARDAGASGSQIVRHVVLPLCKPGIAIGSIFVVTLVMGDFVTVRLMSGGQSASVGLMMANAMSLLQYPAAAANAVVLLLVVLAMVAGMLRIVDIRREL
ncbi:ABC transporter permease [Vineibacter terrae]|uniref:ABC transporter permease n=1 Tax=Vineibacter terrae TaxID=2586908 RepID=A0A5C8PLC3_9HYPH|nr:ABC transporter permease [Vineibacter terrae]TXL74803.1 ABC transporter permease [Vineibacter terrae]